MARQQFVDKIYQYVKEELHNKHFSFNDVWKYLIKEDKLSKEEQKKIIGVVYTDILQDARFVYVGNKKWMLRELASQEEIAKFQNALYDFNPDVVEDNYVPSMIETQETPEIDESHMSEEAEEDLDVQTNLEKTKLEDEEEE